MSLSSESLLAFLSRPRTLHEVAERFAISSTEASRRVAHVVESGQVLVTLRPNATGQEKTWPLRDPVGSILQRPKTVKARKVAIPKTNSSNKLSTMRQLVTENQLLFKLRVEKPFSLQRTPARPPVWELSSRQRKKPLENNHASISTQIGLLQAISGGPKKLSDLRDLPGVSHGTLERLVRNGTLCCDWGPKGVGNFYRITQRGSEELQRLKIASTLSPGLVKKKLITLKAAAPQLGY